MIKKTVVTTPQVTGWEINFIKWTLQINSASAWLTRVEEVKQKRETWKKMLQRSVPEEETERWDKVKTQEEVGEWVGTTK